MESKYRLGRDCMNWTIQKREGVGGGRRRWAHIKWFGHDLALCLTRLYGLWARERFDPDLDTPRSPRGAGERPQVHHAGRA